jgi:hypothetical protein
VATTIVPSIVIRRRVKVIVGFGVGVIIRLVITRSVIRGVVRVIVASIIVGTIAVPVIASGHVFDGTRVLGVEFRLQCTGGGSLSSAREDAQGDRAHRSRQELPVIHATSSLLHARRLQAYAILRAAT